MRTRVRASKPKNERRVYGVDYEGTRFNKKNTYNGPMMTDEKIYEDLRKWGVVRGQKI